MYRINEVKLTNPINNVSITTSLIIDLDINITDQLLLSTNISKKLGFKINNLNNISNGKIYIGLVKVNFANELSKLLFTNAVHENVCMIGKEGLKKLRLQFNIITKQLSCKVRNNQMIRNNRVSNNYTNDFIETENINKITEK